MKVIFLKNYVNKKKGEIANLTNYVAKKLIEEGIVEQSGIAKKSGFQKKK